MEFIRSTLDSGRTFLSGLSPSVAVLVLESIIVRVEQRRGGGGGGKRMGAGVGSVFATEVSGRFSYPPGLSCFPNKKSRPRIIITLCNSLRERKREPRKFLGTKKRNTKYIFYELVMGVRREG